jgi:hypothetical protein
MVSGVDMYVGSCIEIEIMLKLAVEHRLDRGITGGY